MKQLMTTALRLNVTISVMDENFNLEEKTRKLAKREVFQPIEQDVVPLMESFKKKRVNRLNTEVVFLLTPEVAHQEWALKNKSDTPEANDRISLAA